MTGALCNALLMRANQLVPFCRCVCVSLSPVVVIWPAKVKMSLIDRCIPGSQFIGFRERSQICQFRQGSDKKSSHLNGIILLLGILRLVKKQGECGCVFFLYFLTRSE